MPTFEELVEIESPSRLRTRDGALYLSASIVFHAASGHPLTTVVGFVLVPDRLITVRFEALEAFDTPK